MNIDRSVFGDSSRYFTPIDSAERLDAVRSAVFGTPLTPGEGVGGKEGHTSPMLAMAGEKEGVDCLLLIGGADSRDDEWNNTLLKFLLAGTAHPTSEAIQSAVWDAVVCLSRTSVDIYAGPSVLGYLQYVTAAWPNCRIHTPNYRCWSDESQIEDGKIDSFRTMTALYDRIGVMVMAGDAGRKGGSAGEIERWPLVQSFALDESGARPFFSLAKTVIDLTPRIQKALLGHSGASSASHREQLGYDLENTQTSAYAFRRICLSSLTTLRTHWLSFLDHWGTILQSEGKVVTMSILERMKEPMQLYRRYTLERNAQRNSSRGDAVALSVEKKERLHVQFTDPCEGHLRVARTYLLSALGPQDENTQLLFAMVRSFLALHEDDSVMTVEAALTELKRSLPPGASFTTVVMEENNHLVYIEGSYTDASTGAMAKYGDTFLFLPGECVFNLTKAVAPLACLETNQEGLKSAASLKKFVDEEMDVPPSKRSPNAAGLAELGKLYDSCTVADGVVAFASINGTSHSDESFASTHSLSLFHGKCSVSVFEGGFLVHQRQLGVIGPLPFRGSTHCRLQTVSHQADTSRPVVFTFLWQGMGTVDVVILPNTAARRDFVSTWNMQWRSAFGDQLKSCEVKAGTAQGEDVQARVDAALEPVPRDTAPEARTLSDMKSCLNALQYYHGTRLCDGLDRHSSSGGYMYDVQVPFNRSTEEDNKPAATKRIDVVVISGPISAQKHKLVDGLRRGLESDAADRRSKGSSLGVLLLQPQPFDEYVTHSKDQEWKTAFETFAASLPSGGEGVVLLTPPPFSCLPVTIGFLDTLSQQFEKEGIAALRCRHSVTVISPDAYFAAPPEATLAELEKTQQNSSSQCLPLSAFARLCLVPGYFNGLVIRAPSTGRRAGTEALSPEVLSALEQSIAHTCTAFSGRTPYHITYSFQDALSAVLDFSSSCPLPSFGSLAPWRKAARFPLTLTQGLTSVPSPIRHVILRFEKMLITEPNLADFMTYVVSKKAANSTFGSIYCLKALLSVEGKLAEVVAVTDQPHTTRYRQRPRPAGHEYVVRHNQEYHLFLDSEKFQKMMGPTNKNKEIRGAKAQRAESDIFVDIQRTLERQLSTTDSILETLIEAQRKTKDVQLVITKDSLTSQDLLHIADKAAEQNIPLPPGWKVAGDRGGKYVREDDSSTLCDLRPDMDLLVTAYLDELSGHVDAATGLGPFAALGIPNQEPVASEPPHGSLDEAEEEE